MDFLRPTHVHIHLDRLMTNIRFMQGLSMEHAFLCPMIKANAYGHGDVAVAKALEKVNCQFVGVASVEEGLNLRKNYVDLEVLCFGFLGLDAVSEMLQSKLTPVVSSLRQLEHIAKKAKRPVNIHLKLNTGMNRLGLVESDLQDVQKILQDSPAIQVVGIGTHLFQGADIGQESSESVKQIFGFEKMLATLGRSNVFLHVYNSSALATMILGKKKLTYGARPGLLAYGIDPLKNSSLKPLISPVMEFKSKIVSIQQVKSGDVVSYGGIWQAPRDSVVGIVPAGYADGVCRSLSDCGEFLIGGQRAPIRGRVCMDYTMVDCTDLTLPMDRLVGEDVVIFGEQGSQEISVNEVAQKAGRVNYEIMTGISERVIRFYGA
ncbi:MAG: alanine racemase [Pseudomonadota bacterium]